MAKKNINYAPKTQDGTIILYDCGNNSYLTKQLKPTPFKDDLLLTCKSKEEAELIARILNKNSLQPTIRAVQRICQSEDEKEQKMKQDLIKIYKGE